MDSISKWKRGERRNWADTGVCKCKLCPFLNSQLYKEKKVFLVLRVQREKGDGPHKLKMEIKSLKL